MDDDQESRQLLVLAQATNVRLVPGQKLGLLAIVLDLVNYEDEKEICILVK